MDSNLLLLLGAFILGFLIALIIGRSLGRSGFNELEARVSQLQGAADSSKRDVTNLQSEVKVKQDHIDTLNARIGTLEAEIGGADQTRAAALAAVSRAQTDQKTALADRAAMAAEVQDAQNEVARARADRDAALEQVADVTQQLERAQADLKDLRAQLQTAEEEADGLRARLESAAAEEAEREAAALAALFAAGHDADLQEQLRSAGIIVTDEAGADERGGEVQTTLVAPAEGVEGGGETGYRVAELREGLIILALASADLAAAYEARNKAYEELALRGPAPEPKAEPQEQRVVIVVDRGEPAAAPAEDDGLGRAAKAGLVAGGVALAKAADKKDEPAAAAAPDATAPKDADAAAQLEQAKAQYAALQADLQTEVKSKADLAADLQARLDEIGALNDKMKAIDAGLDDVTGVQPEADGRPMATLAKLAILKGIISRLNADNADLQGELHARSTAADELDTKYVALTAEIDSLAGPSPEGTEAPADPIAKLGLIKANVDALSASKGDAEAKLQAAAGEIEGVKGELANVTAAVDALIGPLPEGEAPPVDMAARFALLSKAITSTRDANAELQSKLQAADDELGGLHGQLDAASVEVDALVGPQPEGAPADLTAKLGLIKANIDAQAKANADAQAALEAGAAELQQLKASAEELNKAKADLEAQVQAKDDEIVRLTAEVDKAQAEVDKAHAEFRALASAKDSVDAQLNAMNAQLAGLRGQGDGSPIAKAIVAGTATVGAATIAKKIGEGGKEEAAQPEQPPQPANLVDAIAADMQAREAEIADLKARLEATTTVLQARDAEYGIAKDQLTAAAGLEAKYAELQQQFDEIAAANTKLATLQGEVEALTAAKAELDTAVVDKDKLLGEGQAKLAQLQQEVDALTAAKAELEQAIAAKEQSLGELQANVEGATAARVKIESDLNSRNAEFEALSAKLGAVRSDLDAAVAKRTELEGLVKDRDAAVSALQADLQRIKDESERSTAAKVAEIGVLTAGAATAAAAIKKRDDELAAAQAQVSGLEQQVNALQDQLNDAQARMQALQAENANAAAGQAELAAAQARVTELEEKLAAVQGELDQAVARAAAPAAAAISSGDAQASLTAEPAPATLVVDKSAAMEAARVRGMEPASAACPQDLSEAKGIGSVFEQRLYAAGIGTYWELANLSNDDFVRTLQLNERQMLRMDFDEIRGDAMRLAQETGSVGRMWEAKEPDDFEPLEGIGHLYEKKLYDAGICTYEALASTTVERLQEICPGTKLRTPDYADWIMQARRLAAAK